MSNQHIAINPYELSIVDLEKLIADTRPSSACARAYLEQYRIILEEKKLQETLLAT